MNESSSIQKNEKINQGKLAYLKLIAPVLGNNKIIYNTHKCMNECVFKNEIDLEKIRDVNPLIIPLMHGWKREISTMSKVITKIPTKHVYYISPCGQTLRRINEIEHYLDITNSKLSIDQFSFDVMLHITREFQANDKYLKINDVSDGKEKVSISCVNCVDTTEPEKFTYSTERLPQDGVPLKEGPELDCCDCTDNCMDKMKCQCWAKTYELWSKIPKNANKSLTIKNKIGYKGRRLNKFIASGLFECNSKCKCNSSCGNKVVQNGISVRLQLFKTFNKGWGLRCLDDIPKGAFICSYTGHILTEEQSDERGRLFGDEYFAEIDFGRKYLKRLGWKTEDLSSTEELLEKNENLTKKKNESIYQRPRQRQPLANEDNPFCLSSDSHSNEDNNQASKIQKTDSSELNKHFFRKEVFIIDAKFSGNIARYFNHSCSPNLIVQNVFVETHDFSFPWVCFFASGLIKAGTELNWDYAYEVDSVPGRVMLCHCGSDLCKKRLL